MKTLKTLLFSFILVLVCSVAYAGQDVKFQWDPYTSDTITGFKLYMANTPNVAITPANLIATIPGQSTVTYTHVNPAVGLHYWVLTAYVGSNESLPSNEVNYVVKLKAPSGLNSITVLSFIGNTSILVVNK